MIANLARNSGQCWICRAYFANLLQRAVGSISRALTELVNIGLIKRTGAFYNLLFPVVEITPLGKEYAPRENFSSPETTRPQATGHLVTHPSQGCDTEEKEESYEIKKQTTEPVCLPEKLKKNPEESKTRLMLQSFGINKKKSKEIFHKFPEERIERQIENLQVAIEQGKEIKNKAGWLIKAIKDNYHPSRAQEKIQQEAQAANEEKKRREAERLFQKARDLEREGKLEAAKQAVQGSLSVHKTTATQDLLASLDKLLDKEKALAKARAAISAEQWEAIRAEELEKQLVITRKLGGPKLDKLAQMNAITAANDRLLGGA